MSRVFVASDTHFGHENMAIKRGFKSAEEQDALIVENWNRVVQKRDIVILLGDITFEKANYEILKSLNGRIWAGLGNHDLPQHAKELQKYVAKMFGLMKYKGMFFSHAPIHPQELHRVHKCCHGHVHLDSIDDPRYVNVCMEVINYTPVLVSDIIDNKYKSA
jgi:calcineurin-like phosphoesterase family protein